MNYKTAISFGLVNIPVVLNPVIRDNNTSFNMLHKECRERIKYMKYCPRCEKEVNVKDLIKGYEYSKNAYVFFEEEDFNKLKSEDDRIIEIISFIDIKEIDPVYYEKSYFLKAPDSSKAFNLFASALKKVGKVALAKTIIRDKSYYVILRFGNNSLIMSTLFYFEEIMTNDKDIESNFKKEELDMAIKLINAMSGEFEPEKYNDEYQDRIKEAIDSKVKGIDIKVQKSKKTKTINDLMTALEASIKNKKK